MEVSTDHFLLTAQRGKCALCEIEFCKIIFSLNEKTVKELRNKWLNKKGKEIWEKEKET